MMTSSNHKLSILARMRTTSLALSVVLGLIFISSAAVVDVDVTAQNYDADDNELVLTPSDNLTLRCSGNAPLTWLRNGQPVTLTPGGRFVLTTTKTADSNNSGAWFESELKITGLMYQDTGEITCRYINSSVIRQRTVHIFVYDGLNLMAIVSKTLLRYSVVAGRSAIIECKPTHPNITIRLLDRNTDVTERVKFDRHKGFVISNVTQFFRGMFSCHAELANTSQNVTVAIAYQEPFNTMVEVSSNVSNNEVMVGESFYIECRAHALTTDSVVYMSWKFNATKTGDRISTSRAMMSSNVARSVLTVRNASLSDQGSYQCSANAVESRQSTKQLYIVVHEKAFATLSGSRQYEIDAMQKLDISVSVKAYPPNPELKWYKDGRLLQNDNNRRINYNKIQFSSVRASDAGNYTVVVLSSLVSSSFSFLLVLNVAPSVEIDQDIIGYYKDGQTYTFKCRGMGRPTPTMKWYWQPCLNDSCIATENGWNRVSMNPSPTENRIKEIRNGEETAVMGVVAELSGLYKCEGQNRLGTTQRVIQFFVPGVTDEQEKAAWILIPAAAAVGIIVVLCLFCLLCRSRKNRSKIYVTSFYDRFLLPAPILKGNTSESSGLLEQSEHLAYDPRWEFPKNRLVFKTKLGQGAFGTVVKALAIGVDDSRSATPVAVKMVKDEGNADQLKILASELKVLTNIGAHLNILNVLGAVTRDINKGQLYVIMEYCRYGCLRDFLINKRNDFVDTMNDLAKRHRALPSTADETAALHSYNNENCISEEDDIDDDDEELSPLTTKDLVCYSFQIARGMEFLASKKYIHGDLAARNILLATGNVVKICDFGLAKNCYKTSEYIKKSNTPVPVKWMAVESLTHRVYNMKTDVWSFGILLWELFTVGGNPYATMTINENFVEIIKQGYRLEKPSYCNETTYMLMLQCWNLNPDYRPNFTELVDFFGNLLQASVRQHYTLLDTRYETPVAPSSCAPLNYIQIDVSSSSNSDAEADSLDDASSCPVTSIRQVFEDIDAGYRMPRAVRQCSVESGVFSVSNHRTSVSSRSDALTLMALNGHQPRHRHDRAATASDSSSMEGETMDPWSRKNDYILATPTAVTIADTTVVHRVEEDDNSRRVRLFDRKVQAMDNNNRCSRRSVTSDLSGSVVSDMACDDRCRTPSGTPSGTLSGTPSTPSAPSVYYGRNLPAFAVGEISVV